MLRTVFRLAGLPTGCLLLFSVFFVSGCLEDAKPPDVLLITVDTLRADHVGAWGADGAETPNLDRLARDGARFETAIAPVPLTLPTHATILTGLLPPAHGVRHNGLFRLDDEIPTLASRLGDAGWTTGAVIAARILDRRFGLERGFDHYDDAVEGERATVGGSPERRADAVSDAAIARLRDTGGPIFLWLHYYDAHAEYQPPEPWRKRYARDPYAGEIAWVDFQIGRVLDALQSSGRLDNTLVAVTADHGESLGAHGEHTHGHTLYDDSLHVPWILSGPGVPAGRVVAGPVSLASLAPTLLSLLGQPPLLHSDGLDLGPQLAGAPVPPDSVAYAEALAGRLDHGIHPVHAVRGPEFHYVQSARSELYDLGSDPGALRNLLARPGGPDARHRALAEDYDAIIAEQLAGARVGAAAKLDPELSAQLEALGYAMGDAGAALASDLDYKDALPDVQRYMGARAAHLDGHTELAAQAVGPLLEALPDSPRVHGLAARIAAASGDLPRALAHAETASRLAPDSHREWLLVGDLRAVTGDRDAAGPAWRKAAELNPTEGHVHLRVADWHDRRGEAREALAAYREAGALDERLRTAGALGSAIQLLRLGRHKEAWQVQAEAGSLGDDPVLAHRLALEWRNRQRPDRAIALWTQLLDQVEDERPVLAAARRELARTRTSALPAVAAPAQPPVE